MRPPELLLGNGPASTLGLMVEVVVVATARGVDLPHPADLVRGPDGELTLEGRHEGLYPATTAPEAHRSGPTPATLIYAVGAIGAWATLGDLSPPPADQQAHLAWQIDLLGELERAWGETTAGKAAARLIIRCMDRDPFARPHPEHLLDEVHILGISTPARLPRRGETRHSIDSRSSLPSAEPRAVDLSRSALRAGPRPARGPSLFVLRNVAALALVAALVSAITATCAAGVLVVRQTGPQPGPPIVPSRDLSDLPSPEPVEPLPPSPAPVAGEPAEAPGDVVGFPVPDEPDGAEVAEPAPAPRRPGPRRPEPRRSPPEPDPPPAPKPVEPEAPQNDLIDPWK